MWGFAPGATGGRPETRDSHSHRSSTLPTHSTGGGEGRKGGREGATGGEKRGSKEGGGVQQRKKGGDEKVRTKKVREGQAESYSSLLPFSPPVFLSLSYLSLSYLSFSVFLLSFSLSLYHTPNSMDSTRKTHKTRGRYKATTTRHKNAHQHTNLTKKQTQKHAPRAGSPQPPRPPPQEKTQRCSTGSASKLAFPAIHPSAELQCATLKNTPHPRY